MACTVNAAHGVCTVHALTAQRTVHAGTITGCATASPPPSGYAACRPSRGAGGPTRARSRLCAARPLTGAAAPRLQPHVRLAEAATPCSRGPTRPACNPAHTRVPRWLGPRHVLLLGDSLMAQLYYSLVWLLGDSLLEQHDLYGYAPGESTVGSHRLGACASRPHTVRPHWLHWQAGTCQSRAMRTCLAWGWALLPQPSTRLRSPHGRPRGPCAPRAVLSSAALCGLQVRDHGGQRGRLDEPGEAARRRHDHQGAAARRSRARAA